MFNYSRAGAKNRSEIPFFKWPPTPLLLKEMGRRKSSLSLKWNYLQIDFFFHSSYKVQKYTTPCTRTSFIPGFIFVSTIFVQNEKCSPFLELTPRPLRIPRGVTNISKDWADFCQTQEFWCHFFSFVLGRKCPFWLWEGALRLSKEPSQKSKGTFLRENDER